MSRIFNKSNSSPNFAALAKTSPILQRKNGQPISKTNSFRNIFGKDQPAGSSSPLALSQNVKASGPIFGTPLATTVENDMANDNLQVVPFLVEECIVYLNRDDIFKIEGLFRQSGKSTEIQDIRKLYDSGKYITLHDNPDAHVVTGLLKLYLRELPEPLITFSLFEQFIDYQRTSGRQVGGDMNKLRGLIEMLPMANKILLKVLCLLLKKASEFEKFSKMNASSLAIVIGPNILRRKEQDIMQAMEDSPLINNITCAIIENAPTLFTAEDLSEYSLDYFVKKRQTRPVSYSTYTEAQAKAEEKQKTRSFLAAFFSRRPKQEDLVKRGVLHE